MQSEHISPVTIRTELANIEDPATTIVLADDIMAIRPAQAMNKGIASNLVDEHQLETTLTIPDDCPPHNEETQDGKYAGGSMAGVCARRAADHLVLGNDDPE